jgi:hypothetical protein
MWTLFTGAIVRVKDGIVWTASDAARLLGMKRLADLIDTGGGPRPVK